MAEPTVAPASPRDLWMAIEPIHAVIYFAADIHAELADAGTKGFWMGYFGARAAPMGAVSTGVVNATFFNFEPGRVARAVPDVWALAAPERLVEVRRTASARHLRRLTRALAPGAVEAAADAVEQVAAALHTAGRPLAAANRALTPASDPYERLWQAATTVREHRGDGHVAVLVAHGLDGIEAHVLQAAAGVVPRRTLQAARGWSDEQWDGAARRLRERGWLDLADALTSAGAEGRAVIEAETDALAAVHGVDLDAVIDTVTPFTDAVTAAGVVTYPNPIGLPPPA